MKKDNENLLRTMAKTEDEKKKKFEVFYKKLIEYKKVQNDFYGVTTDPQIGSLVTRIRAAYKGKKTIDLTQEMIDKLNEIDFPWQAGYGRWFNYFFERLVNYKNEHGSFYGVTKDKEIGFYVSYIRNGFLKIDQTKRDKLNEIGFTWAAEYGLWFEPFYKKLIRYKEEKGNFKSLTTDPELANTVQSVRGAYKGRCKLRLTQEMIDKLNEIGFPWEGRVRNTNEKSV